MKKVVITLNAEQKVEMAKKLGIINDQLIIVVPDEGEDVSALKKMENSLYVNFIKKGE